MCERKEKSPCESQHYPLTKSEVPTEDLEVSARFLGHVRMGNIVVVEGKVMVNFLD